MAKISLKKKAGGTKVGNLLRSAVKTVSKVTGIGGLSANAIASQKPKGMEFKVGQGLTPAQTTIANKKLGIGKTTTGGLTYNTSDAGVVQNFQNVGTSQQGVNINKALKTGGISNTNNNRVASIGSNQPLASTDIINNSLSSNITSLTGGTNNVSSQTASIPTSNIINTPNLGDNTSFTYPELTTPDYNSVIPSQVEQANIDIEAEQKKTEEDFLKNLMKDFNNTDTASEIDAKLQKELGIADKQKEVNDLTSKLNAIVAKGEANQISLIGQGRGIPEAIIGGQQAQIGRETAIAALPVQAQLEAAQGNLDMANESLDRLFKIYSEEAEREFAFKKEVRTFVYETATAKQKRKLELLDKVEERNYQELKDLHSEQQTYAKMAFENGQSSLGAKIAKLDYKSPTFKQDLANLQSQLKDPIQDLQRQKLQQDLLATDSTINPKILNTSQFKNAQSAVNLKNTLQRAIDAVKKYGNYEKANATGKGLLDSLKVQLRSEISTALEQGVVVPGEAAAFDSIAGQLNKSPLIRNEKTLSSLQNLVNSMDSRVSVQKAALTNTYQVSPEQIDTLLNITDLTEQEYADMDALIY